VTRFTAEYVDSSGISRSEALEAESREGALESLAGKRPWLRSLKEAPEARDGLPALVGRLAVLVGRAVPLGPALQHVAQSARDHTLRDSLSKAAVLTDEGMPLTEALRTVGGPMAEPAFLELVQSGERSGQLSDALDCLASLAGRLAQARREVLARLLYPVFLACMASLLAAGVVATGGSTARALIELMETNSWRVPFFVPAMAMASEMPVLVWGAALAVCVLTLGSWLRARASSPFAPSALLGEPARQALLLRLFSAMVGSGIPLPQAWTTLGSALTPLLEERSRGIAEDGGDAAATFAAAGLVTPAEGLGVEAAQRAGPMALVSELEGLASRREQQARQRAERIALRFELCVDACVGAVVLAVALATLPSGYGFVR
jgi:type II secretory pathway component PulF